MLVITSKAANVLRGIDGALGILAKDAIFSIALVASLIRSSGSARLEANCFPVNVIRHCTGRPPICLHIAVAICAGLEKRHRD